MPRVFKGLMSARQAFKRYVMKTASLAATPSDVDFFADLLKETTAEENLGEGGDVEQCPDHAEHLRQCLRFPPPRTQA